MQALDDPNYTPGGQPSGGKKVDELYVMEDDFALMRLIEKIDELGGASLEQKLEKYGDPNKWIMQSQFTGMLKHLNTPLADYTPLYRVVGFAHQTGQKKKKIADIMFRINDRDQMKRRIEHQTLTHIATYLDKQESTLTQLFNRFNTNNDDYLSQEELFEMLEFIHIKDNVQRRRIIVSMFDKNRDDQISKSEFTQALSKYTKKAPITEIESKIIAEKDKKDLIKMFNEEHREKQVYEDFKFDETDKDELQRREEETIRLIKEGKLPVKSIGGNLVLKLRNFENLATVPGKEVCMYKLHRAVFKEDGTKVFQQPKLGFMKHFSREQSLFKCQISLDDMEGSNMHACGDTMLLQLYLAERADPALRKKASFVGEVLIKWK